MASSVGGISGRVLTRTDGEAVPGAVVELQELGLRATAGPDGGYAFPTVPPGRYTLVVKSASGRIVRTQAVVVAGSAARQDIAERAEGTAVEEIVVQAQRAPKALTRAVEREAPNIVSVQAYQEIRKLPDVSVAEAVRRVPGISLETDEGEGRYVNIRGLDADLNSTTFGGLRLPPTNNASPFGGYRAVTMDSIPIGLVGAITVTKSNLPDQDAEALGGTIEITPKTAPPGGQPFVQGNIGSGYEPLRGTPILDGAITAGGHFGGPDGFFSPGPFSIVVTATRYEDRRGIDDVEPGYFNDPQGQAGARPYGAINNIQQRDYEPAPHSIWGIDRSSPAAHRADDVPIGAARPVGLPEPKNPSAAEAQVVSEGRRRQPLLIEIAQHLIPREFLVAHEVQRHLGNLPRK
jgi:hypothetical protein